jgi:hypothetical protein
MGNIHSATPADKLRQPADRQQVIKDRQQHADARMERDALVDEHQPTHQKRRDEVEQGGANVKPCPGVHTTIPCMHAG